MPVKEFWTPVREITEWILHNHEDKISYITSSIGLYNGYISVNLLHDDGSRTFLKEFSAHYNVQKFTRNERYPSRLECTVGNTVIAIDGVKTSYSVSCEKVCTATFPDGRKIVLTPTEIDVETAVSE